MKCVRPECTGEIVDGYCDVCGMAPASPTNGPQREGGGTVGLPGPSSPTVASSGGTRRAGTGGTRTSARNRLGAGLVEIPSMPYRDPGDAVMSDPSVPESRRFCGHCNEPVGRSRDGAPGRTSGFCRNCGKPFSFEPRLSAGELVAGQYEVRGCLAHGGMGWVYLARDRNVSDRWVVLKGLLNANDRDATDAALAERQFLAEVEHPNIVKIFNFVEHDGSGYIVMEYVGGRSLKQILAARREANGDKPDPLPPSEAIAYMLEILPAFGYLHDTGLLFCDFKLDNVIQTQHSLKLIDLGGVYRMDDPSGAVFGTVGYQAPEIANAGPSIASDLFTVGRTLAVLCIDFRGYQSTYRFTLPPADSVPLFARYDALYRLILKATAADPDDRFQSADEMAEGLYGVLREIVAQEEGRVVAAPSALFTAPVRARTDRTDWRVLPRPQASSDDASAGYLAAVTATDPQQMIAQLRAAPERTVEVELRLAAAMIEAGDFEAAEESLQKIEEADPWEWRVAWYRGLGQLVRGEAEAARTSFWKVYSAVPGELAPKLAVGIALETSGDLKAAARWYASVTQTDPTVTSAAFGLARCLLSSGDRTGAITAYERIPDSSSGYLDAQSARIHCLSSGNGAGEPTLDDVMSAGAVLEDLPVDGEQRDQLSADLLAIALRLAIRGANPLNANGSLLGCALAERELRLALEAVYRGLARRAATRAERIRLIDEANQVRPRTWT